MGDESAAPALLLRGEGDFGEVGVLGGAGGEGVEEAVVSGEALVEHGEV